MKTDEAALIARIKSGHTEDFAYFLDKYGPPTLRLIAGIVGQTEDAEELTQDAFMQAYQHLDTFRSGSRVSTWLYRIAYNLALGSRRKLRPTLFQIDNAWERLTDEEADATFEQTNTERVEALHRTLPLLTPDERTLLTLFYTDGLPITEIAAVIGTTEGNAKVRLSRTRKKLAGTINTLLFKHDDETR